MKKAVSIAATLLFILSSFSAPAFAADRNEILVVGDEDEWVLELQKSLHDQGYLEFPATGFFGTDTQNAVMRFQKDNGLFEDGKAGPETRELLLNSDYKAIPSDRVVEGYVKTTTTYIDNSVTVSDELIGKILKPASNKQDSNKTEAKPKPADNANIAENKSSGDMLYPGDKGEAISSVQSRLSELQYYEYPTITGYYGPVTQEAVKKFQRTNGLAQDGMLNSETMALLFSDGAKIYMMCPGDSGDDIRALQEKLVELGYLTAEPTGYYGDATVAAVMAFQEKNSLDVDGKAGQMTRSVLYSGNAIPALIMPSDEPQPAPELPSTPVEQPAQPDPVTPDPQPAPEPQPEPTPAPTPEPTPEPAPSTATGLDRVLEIAHAQLGKPYVYGSNGPDSFDCSGFVYYTLKNSGIAVSRLSSATYATVSNWQTVDSMDALQTGDLVFFKSDSGTAISHVGIYLGGGTFIHAAPSSGGVAISGMTSGYYLRNYVTGKRIF